MIVFKDGYCLIIKQGEATTDEKGQVYLDDVPDAAVLGLVLGRADRRPAGEHGRRLEGSEGDQPRRKSPCTQTIELLLANKGKLAKIELHDKTISHGIDPRSARRADADRRSAGLARALLSQSLRRRTLPAAARATTARERRTQMTTRSAATTFILRTDDGRRDAARGPGPLAARSRT